MKGEGTKSIGAREMRKREKTERRLTHGSRGPASGRIEKRSDPRVPAPGQAPEHRRGMPCQGKIGSRGKIEALLLVPRQKLLLVVKEPLVIPSSSLLSKVRPHRPAHAVKRRIRMYGKDNQADHARGGKKGGGEKGHRVFIILLGVSGRNKT